MVKISRQIVVFDAADLDAEATFWAGVLGGTIISCDEDDWRTICVEDIPMIAVQLVPDHKRPQWPGGVPQQIHLDLWVEDFDEANKQVTALGARVLQSVDMLDSDRSDAYQVYADPAGHPFCLCFERTK